MQVPVTDAAAESGPPYEVEVQLLMPEVWSVPLNVTRTSWLYQPPASAARTGEPPTTTGGVASRLIFSSAVVAWPLLSTALQNASAPPGGVSVVWVSFTHPVL